MGPRATAPGLTEVQAMPPSRKGLNLISPLRLQFTWQAGGAPYGQSPPIPQPEEHRRELLLANVEILHSGVDLEVAELQP